MSLGWLDHFEVLRFLGRGGMSDVYVAHDSHLDCDVALKVLREDHAGDSAHRTRLLGEARALAKLDHPNIVGILDCGEAAPRPPDFLWPAGSSSRPERVVYLAMRYVEGTDLTEAIRAQRLAPERAVGWAMQVARGLEAAHARGVVHRDLKPANIRVTPDDVLKIVDFGLASSHHRTVESMDPTQSPTREIIIGTVGYCAPEQCEEAGHADPRCDLFSLGVILYEMVTGRQAFEGDSVVAVLREIATHDPPPMRRYARDVPDELERIVGKLLKKDPKQRYQSAHEVVTDLEQLRTPRARPPVARRTARVALAVALVVAVLAGLPLLCKPRPPETLAVVEFENLTGDLAMDRIASGLGLDLVTSLVQACRVNVVVSTLREPNGLPTRDPARVAAAYRAQTVLLGTLHFEGAPGSSNVLSLHLSIVRAADNSTPWAQSWSAPAQDVAELMRRMTAAVVERWPRIPTAEASPLETPKARPGAAVEAYLRGIALLADSDPVARDSSLVEFDRALSLDPAFGRALAGRARAQLAGYLHDRDTTRLAPAEMDARQAVKFTASELDGRLALARILLERGRTAEAIAELRSVLRLNEGVAEAYSLLGAAHRNLGDMDQARRYFQSAVELEPSSPKAWRALGRFLLLSTADFAAAEKALRMEIQLNPAENRGYEDLAAGYVLQCRYADAIATYAKLPKPGARSLDLANNRGTAYFFNGNFDLALRDFLAAASDAPEDGDWRMSLGDCYARTGHRDDALREYALARRFFERDLVANAGDLDRRARYALSLARCGDLARSREEVDRCVAANPWRDTEVVHYLAKSLAICGERERALAALDTLVNARGASKCLLAVEDEFAGLRADRRFRALVGNPRR